MALHGVGSMIVHDRHLVRAFVGPPKDNAPLIVDSNTVLPVSTSRQGLEAVSRRDPQIIQVGGVVENHQFSLCPPLDVLGESADTPSFSDRLSVSVSIAPDHMRIVV